MLPKKNRADRKTVNKIFKEGRFLGSENLTIKFLKNDGIKKFSVVVPKGVVKLAVKRNALRRQGYLFLEKHIKQSPFGFLGVLVFKKQPKNKTELEKDIKIIFNKIK